MTLAPTQRFVSFPILAPWVYTIISIFWTASRGKVVDGELPVVGLSCFESGQKISVCKWWNWLRFILYMATSLYMNGFWAALSCSRALGDWTERRRCGWYHGDIKLLRWLVLSPLIFRYCFVCARPAKSTEELRMAFANTSAFSRIGSKSARSPWSTAIPKHSYTGYRGDQLIL